MWRMKLRAISAWPYMLLGTSLVGTGMKYWGGGAVCADMAWKNHAQAWGSLRTRIRPTLNRRTESASVYEPSP